MCKVRRVGEMDKRYSYLRTVTVVMYQFLLGVQKIRCSGPGTFPFCEKISSSMMTRLLGADTGEPKDTSRVSQYLSPPVVR